MQTGLFQKLASPGSLAGAICPIATVARQCLDCGQSSSSHTADIQSHKEELDRMKRDLNFAHERAEDASRHKSTEVSDIMSKYNRQLTELEDSLRVRLHADQN